MDKIRYVAKTMAGLEELLAGEIKELGGTEVKLLHRAVAFEGDLETLYKVNLWSRLALRVIKPFLEFKAHNETVFYKRLRRFDWTEVFNLEQTFRINSSVHSDVYTHSQYIALKTKDAIVDQFRSKHKEQRPNIDLEHPDFVFDVYCNGIDFIISIDSSGESLHRRGYRQSMRRAPLNETLAAGMIMLSGWDRKSPLYDPMCGSGTILTEAYLLAHNIPPRMERKHFAFMNWSDFDSSLWQGLKDEASEAINDDPVQLRGTDIEANQIDETLELIEQLQMERDIKIEVGDFFEVDPPVQEGMIIMNPPYGLRIEEADITGFYKTIGDTFKKKYQGWQAWVLSGNKDAIKTLGLRTSKKLTLYNASIECKYHRYDMYGGTRKTKKEEIQKVDS